MAAKKKPAPSTENCCGGTANNFADLPPELRPKPKTPLGGLRRVTCPACGLQYWTNRPTDTCRACQNNFPQSNQ